MRDGFILHEKTMNMIECMDGETLKEFMTALIAHYRNEEEQIESLAAKVAFIDAKDRMDADTEAYENNVERRSSAGKKGAEARWNNSKVMANDGNAIANDGKRMAKDGKDMANDGKDMANDGVSVSVSVLKEKDIPTVYPKRKEQKHQYGEYKHVLLTDSEHDRLCADYGIDTTSEAITFLDAYIEEKGYKSKSHNLALRRWVFDALKDKSKKNKWSAKVDNRNYEMDELERQLYAAQGV